MTTRTQRLWIAGLLAVFVGLFARTAGYDYVWDDAYEIEHTDAFDRPLIEGLALTQMERQDPALVRLHEVTLAYDSYRPLLFATFWLENRAFGRDPGPMHVTNIVLGVLAILIAYALVRRWLASAGIPWPYALVATAIFALHPMQVETIAYISARGDLLAGLLAITAAYAAHRAVHGRSSWILVAAIAFAGWLFTKEACIGLPAALLVVAASLGELRRHVRVVLVLVVVAIGYLVVRAAMVSATTQDALGNGIAGMPGTWLDYLRITLLPFDLSTERLHSHALTIPGWLIAGIAVVTVIALRKRALPPAVRLAGGGLGWFALLLGPAAVSIMAAEVAADRYGYAALLGFALAVAALAHHTCARGPRARRLVQIGLGAWALLAIAVAWMQVPVWRTNETLYTHAVTMTPESSSAFYRLGFLDARAGDWDRAIPLLVHAIELDPHNVQALNNLGVGYLHEGQLPEAEDMLSRALAENPAHYKSWFNLGLTRLRLGKQREGCANVGRAIEINPSYAMARDTYRTSCSKP